jgi:glycosyltransferase involved in cell wall biosynthesis
MHTNAHEDINFQAMAGASNKAFDYLACGLPLIVSDVPEWQELYVKTGFALACVPEHPASIAKAITWFLEHPTDLWQMGERGRQRICAEWNYETQFQPVVDMLGQ